MVGLCNQATPGQSATVQHMLHALPDLPLPQPSSPALKHSNSHTWETESHSLKWN